MGAVGRGLSVAGLGACHAGVCVAGAVAEYRELGADEVVLYCYGDDPGQVEVLAALIE
ncbi:hypothetical protein ACIA5D_22670 [Actinoplanes sp. NPDC051513]|uniref:hypothetical protein n=1 Tax=Actinoplanes sp. NPDC051513 TaxID=3363908 RepID=UPI0037B8694E